MTQYLKDKFGSLTFKQGIQNLQKQRHVCRRKPEAAPKISLHGQLMGKRKHGQPKETL